MALRRWRTPASSRRKPVSIGWRMEMRTSTASPRAAWSGSWMRARATLVLRASGFAHLDLDHVGPERAVGEAGDGDHALRAVQAQARGELGAGELRPEVERRHVAHRVFLRDEVHRSHVVGGGHGAVDLHRHRHRVAVVGDLRQHQRHLSRQHVPAVGERAHQRVDGADVRIGRLCKDPRTEYEGNQCKKLPALHPLPTKGILVAMMVMNWTLVSSGKFAICSTAWPTWATSMRASTMTVPFACCTPLVMRSVISVAALPMSIWPQAMSCWRPSSEIDLVRPVTACLVAV